MQKLATEEEEKEKERLRLGPMSSKDQWGVIQTKVSKVFPSYDKLNQLLHGKSGKLKLDMVLRAAKAKKRDIARAHKVSTEQLLEHH